MLCRDRVPKQPGRVRSLKIFHCRDRDMLAPCHDKECCVATGFGLGVGHLGTESFLSRQSGLAPCRDWNFCVVTRLCGNWACFESQHRHFSGGN